MHAIPPACGLVVMASPLTLDALAQSGTVLLDTARANAENQQSLLFADPAEVLTARTLDEVAPLLESIDTAVDAGYSLAGYLGYEAGYAFEDFDPTPPRDGPLAWFGVYEDVHTLAPEAVDAFWSASDIGDASPQEVGFSIDRADYLDAIDAIKMHIREGDVYQINYTGKVSFALDGMPQALYRALRARQRVPYGAFLNLGRTSILSYSPELFFRRDGRHIVTRPMKGTVRRGRTLEEDRELQDWLRHDAKSRAENLMIVDLLRNDLSVCCTPGSVEVPALFTTEVYDTVTQMTSTVEGQLRPDVGYAELFRALFPCGSVTGAPKIRAMQIIRALEEAPRGAYCGAIGYIAPDDTAVFNVAIRTAVLQDDRGEMGTGGGIVWDSDPEAEYEECRLKARFLEHVGTEDGGAPSGDFELIETMRWEGGSIELWAYHKKRLRDSAAYFGYPFDVREMRAAVEHHAATLDPAHVYKVRLTLDRQGQFAVTSESIAASSEQPLQLMVASQRIDSSDPFRYHKTTHRQVYEAAYQAAQAAGYDEALLLNECGEVTEGARTNVFAELDGALVTPPVSCGVLNGVYRRYVLDTHPEATEQVLHIEDLKRADDIYCCNAVRGWQRAKWGTSHAPNPIPAKEDR